jgi:hypothetical protein
MQLFRRDGRVRGVQRRQLRNGLLRELSHQVFDSCLGRAQSDMQMRSCLSPTALRHFFLAERYGRPDFLTPPAQYLLFDRRGVGARRGRPAARQFPSVTPMVADGTFTQTDSQRVENLFNPGDG